MTSQEQLNQPELSPEDITPPIPVPVNQPGLPWPRTVQVHAGSLRALVILGC